MILAAGGLLGLAGATFWGLGQMSKWGEQSARAARRQAILEGFDNDFDVTPEG